MADALRTLVLSDGDAAAILACTAVRESLAASTDAPDEWPLVMPFPSYDGRASSREQAILRQAEALKFRVLPSVGTTAPTGATVGELEARELISAAYAAARAGCRRVIWPAHGAIGANVDLDRVSQIVDRAFFAARLAASDASLHGAPDMTIETPYADYTDEQIADCVADLLAPLHLVWWRDDPASGSVEFASARARWAAAFEAVGWPLTEVLPSRA